jgi:GT2 family glycosyltransferase
MDLSIIIVNWNSGKLVYECIKSINDNTKSINYEIIVVDNNSADKSYLDLVGKEENVRLIYSSENLGFSRGNNLGAKNAKGEYILCLNPDTIILKDAITKSLTYIKQQKGDNLIGIRLLNKGRTLQISSCKFFNCISYFFGTFTMSNKMHYKNHETDWVMGAFMLLPRSLYFKISGFNESYFMYSEDLELCYRVKQIGGKVLFFNEAQIIHLYNQSGKKKWNNKRNRIVTESLEKFVYENYTGINKWSTLLSIKFKNYIKGMGR